MYFSKVEFVNHISNSRKKVFLFSYNLFSVFDIFDFLYKNTEKTKREINFQKTEKSNIWQMRNCK